jgi:tetratricopeptide (TPR) repeat protein
MTKIIWLTVWLFILPLKGFADDELDHLIKPGYQPAEAQDEQGLWLEFKDMERELNKSALLVKKTDLRNYVEGIVCRVSGDYCGDFRVYVVRNPGFNASMTATGMMQVWTGTIVRASSTDEIAAVIGHEVAHYTRLHSLQGFRKLKSQMTKASVFDLGFAVLTGVSAPLGQAAALLNYLSFNREQETEADLLGVRLLAEAAYDPHAAYRVWYQLLEEEAAAAVKREQMGIFSQTHPNSDDRANYLKSYVENRYGPPDVEQVADQALLDILNDNYLLLMEDQLDTNRFGRTREILERHTRIGVKPGLVNYFFGEMYRQRGNEGDQELALAAYTKSVESETAPPEAHKNLGYLYLKGGNLARAQDSFRQYLELQPGATDRAMIEFYLEEDAQ